MDCFRRRVSARIWEDTDTMKHMLLSGVAVCALATGAFAADLKFPVGEGPFSWDSYTAWAEAAPDLKGKTVTIRPPAPM